MVRQPVSNLESNLNGDERDKGGGIRVVVTPLACHKGEVEQKQWLCNRLSRDLRW